MLKRKITGIILLITLAAFISITTTRCYDDNDKEARVTIHLERNDLAAMGIQPKKYFIDRVLQFFSTPVEAASSWNGGHYDLTLNVTCPSFEPISVIIPAGTNEYSLIIPSANNVTFAITSYYDVGGFKNWGGYKNLNLGPGDQDIKINMIPITIISNISSGGTWIEIQWSTTPLDIVTGYSIYRSTDPNGPYSKIAIVPGNTSDIYTDNDPTLKELIIYYYKISVNTANETGFLSDYDSGQLMF